MATDWVDGWLARRTSQISELGKILDPTADRLAIAAGLIALVVRGVFPPWAALLVLVRDAVIFVWACSWLTLFTCALMCGSSGRSRRSRSWRHPASAGNLGLPLAAPRLPRRRMGRVHRRDRGDPTSPRPRTSAISGVRSRCRVLSSSFGSTASNVALSFGTRICLWSTRI